MQGFHQRSAAGRPGRRHCVRRGIFIALRSVHSCKTRFPGPPTHDLKAGVHHLSIREAYGATWISLGSSLVKSTFGRRRSDAAAGRLIDWLILTPIPGRDSLRLTLERQKSGSPLPFEEAEVSMWCRITCRIVACRLYTVKVKLGQV